MDATFPSQPDPEPPFRYVQLLRERVLERARRVAAEADRRLRNVLGTWEESRPDRPPEEGRVRPIE